MMDWTLASKLLPYLIYPLNFSLWLLLLSLFWMIRKRHMRAGFALSFAVVVLVLSSSSAVSGWLVNNLENQYPVKPVEAYPQSHTIIVLGGSLGLPVAPRLYPDLKDSSDRIWHAVRLFNANKAPTIFLSGGHAFKSNPYPEEATYIAKLLQQWGVPEQAIALDILSGSTRENAVEVYRYLAEKSLLGEPILLVTSAWHMPRAMMTFKKMGINAIAAPTDIKAVKSTGPSVFKWLPSSGSLGTTRLMMKEYLGIWVYKLRGWA